MTSRRRPYSLAIAVAGLSLAVPCARARAEEPFDRTPVTCIIVSRVDYTKIVDEQTVLFYLPGDRVFRNRLHNGCPSLDRDDTIGYGVTPSRLARLCAGDLINTEEGVGCRVGPFEPITADEAKEILAADERDAGDVSSSDAALAPTASEAGAPPAETPAVGDQND
jgi:hypothetical protein